MQPDPTAALNRAVRSLDGMDDDEAARHLGRCCGARKWIEAMLRRRPFQTRDGLLAAAEGAADGLQKEDWLEAFSHHPRIGDIDRLRQRFAATAAWSEGEQAAVGQADEAVLAELAQKNRAYEDRFGFIFIVCASGKSAAQMLELLNHRLNHVAAMEWQVAAGEQRQITRLRLDRLITEELVGATPAPAEPQAPNREEPP